MSPYPKYKPSGVEWLGDVPAHWDVKRLKMAVRLIDKKVEADEASPLPYIGLENVESWTGRLLPINLDFVPTGIANAFKADHTLLGKLRPYLAKACNPGFDGLCSTEILVLKGIDICRDALLYFMLSDGFIKLVNASTYGSKMPRASWDFIGDCAVPIAPSHEQLAITEFLDRQTATIDKLVSKKRTLIERLNEKRAALVSRTVTRGLPPDAARAAGVNPHPKLCPSGIDWLGDVPEHWDVRRMKDAGDLYGGAGFPHEYQGITDEELPFYKVGDLALAPDGKTLGVPMHSISRATASELRARVIPKGSIIYAKIGAALFLNRRRLTPVECCIDNNMTAFVPRHSRLSHEWAFHWMSTLDFGEFANPGAVPSFSEGYQGVLPLLLPPPAEQNAIVDFLERETARLHPMVAKAETALERLREYRTVLITAAVTGKIDVRLAVA